ncbi:ATP-dependent RNA helicase [Reticulomyxa filosa]|uniref:ATP-dependent RNA helicase n=1 Tax=Reticulomyxa filosa TaxID=46433 RepID=X6N424_RETFI|nr:ATP-dependent RNA helicase [Reticulomyxa filosa]|eukprot:ETO20663.1 ATP-dependent RNA helicase [Reticulomyxa filosa]
MNLNESDQNNEHNDIPQNEEENHVNVKVDEVSTAKDKNNAIQLDNETKSLSPSESCSREDKKRKNEKDKEKGHRHREKEKKSRNRSKSKSKSRSRSRNRHVKKTSHSRKDRRSRSRSDSHSRHRRRRRHKDEHSYHSRYRHHHHHRSISRSRTRSDSKHNSKSPPETNDVNNKLQEKEKKKPDRIWNGFAWISVEPNKTEGQKSDPKVLNENEIARKRCETVLAANHRALGQALAVAQLVSNLSPLSLIHGNALVTNALLGRGNATNAHPNGLNGPGLTAISAGTGLSLNRPTPAQGLNASDNNTAFAMAYNAANSAIQQQLNKWLPGESGF